MTFNQIRYFITLAETLSYTDASKILFITQPNLSRQIKSMEEELGLDLFVRHTRNIKLTPSGVILYQRFKDLMKNYDSAVNEAILANKGFEGQLSIEILDVFDIAKQYPDLLNNIKKAHPKLELKLRRRSLGELIKDMRDHTADLILTYSFSTFNQSDWITIDVGLFDSCIMLSRKHPLANKKHLTLVDLRDTDFVQLDPDISKDGARYLDAIMSRAGIHPKIHSVDSMNDVMLWVETQNAAAITSTVSTEWHNPNVRIYPIDMPEAKNHAICFAWRKDNYNPAIATFMEQVEKTIIRPKSEQINQTLF